MKVDDKDRTCKECSNFNPTKGDCNLVQYICEADDIVGNCDGFELSGKTNIIRIFDTGATRDMVQGKLDYVKALSPIVLRRYVQYLDKHRLQPDGNMRDFNNWKKGMSQDVYHSSNARHFMAAWLLTEGYATEDNYGPVELEDSLCGELFNIMGRLHEILKAKLTVDRTKPVSGGY